MRRKASRHSPKNVPLNIEESEPAVLTTEKPAVSFSGASQTAWAWSVDLSLASRAIVTGWLGGC